MDKGRSINRHAAVCRQTSPARPPRRTRPNLPYPPTEPRDQSGPARQKPDGSKRRAVLSPRESATFGGGQNRQGRAPYGRGGSSQVPAAPEPTRQGAKLAPAQPRQRFQTSDASPSAARRHDDVNDSPVPAVHGGEVASHPDSAAFRRLPRSSHAGSGGRRRAVQGIAARSHEREPSQPGEPTEHPTVMDEAGATVDLQRSAPGGERGETTPAARSDLHVEEPAAGVRANSASISRLCGFAAAMRGRWARCD